ncbi:hypothetical protein GCM10023331_41220 [Algivirga pacifica]|uniref:Uncharacterized protein n=2 Tax=Algivirga pacifica TaxID=1162670 RepID=A0ABP9DM73_9BACT
MLLLYPTLYFLKLNSCRYKEIVNWYIMTHYNDQITGRVIDMQFTLPSHVNYIDTQRYPGKDGSEEIWFSVKGTKKDIYVKIELSQHHLTGNWTIENYSYYDNEFSTFFEMEEAEKYLILRKELDESYLIQSNSENCIERL